MTMFLENSPLNKTMKSHYEDLTKEKWKAFLSFLHLESHLPPENLLLTENKVKFENNSISMKVIKLYI